MKKWSAHMLTGMKNMTRKMSVGRTCRTDAGGPACRRGATRGAMRVARFAVMAVMAMVFGLAGFVVSADAATMGNGSNGTSASTTTAQYMYIDNNNPATFAGLVTDISANMQSTGNGQVKFFTCSLSGTNCTVTDQTGWLTFTGTGVKNWSGLSMAVNNGDILGFVTGNGGPTVGRKNTGTRYQYHTTQGATPTNGNTYAYTNGTNTDGLMIGATYSAPCTPAASPTMNGGSYGGDPVDICAAVTAGSNTITNYKVTGGGSSPDDDFQDNNLNAKWTMDSVGNSTNASVSETGGTLQVTNAGVDLWETSDDYTLVRQGPFTGDFTITSKVNSVTNANVWTKAGVMIIDDLPNVVNRPKFAGMVITPGSGASFQRRYNQGGTGNGDYASSTAAATAPEWVRLVRTGSTVEGFYSNDGVAYTSLGTDTVTFTGDVYIGVWATSHAAGTTATAVFEDFTTSGFSTTMYDGATCNSIPSTTWGDGTYNLEVTYTDSCSTTGQTTTGTFDYTACTPDAAPVIGGTINGDPANLCLAVSDGSNTMTNYKVVETGGAAPQSFGSAGAGYINLTGSGVDYFGTTGTIEGWWYFNGTAGGNVANTQRLWGLDTDSECRFSAAGTLSCEVGGSTTTSPAGYFKNQTWYHITYTWNETTNVAEIWAGTDAIAPVRITNNTGWTGTVSTKGAGINVNMSPGNAGQIVNGYVSEVRMWNDVRTSGEITANSAAGTLVGNEAGLIGLYGFNGDYTDKSGNGADAVVAGTGGALSTTVPSNESGGSITRYDGSTCNAVTTTGWTDGATLALELVYTNSCGSTGRTTAGSFVWNSCNETLTMTGITLSPSASPIIGPVTVTAVGTATTREVRWSEDGGSTWSGWGASGSAVYTPTLPCASGNVIFQARGDGSCPGNVVSYETSPMAWDTTDKDLATLTVTGPASPVGGIKTVSVLVGTETVPDGLSAVVVNITNAGACNVSNGFMTWNGGTSRWEYGWDTTACGTGAVVNGVSIVASATDMDCGDNVTSPAATVAIDNTCIPTAGTVSWTPPGTTIDTPTAVTATLTGSAVSPEVSFDNGNTWLPNGSVFTPGLDDYGTENFLVRAFNNCGIRIYGGPYVVISDGRIDRIRPLSVTATAAGKTSIRILMRYCSDKNNNALTTVRYKLTSDPDVAGSWTTIGPLLDGSDADTSINEEVLVMLTNLTTDTSYDIEVSVTDTDVVDWTTIQVDQPTAPPWLGTVALSSWTDSPLLHNALRFACSTIGYSTESDCTDAGGTWTLGRKWANGWGLPDLQYPGAEYDGFECSTCHMKNSSNIKRVIPSVVAPTGTLPGSTIDLQTVVEGNADFGDDSDNHTDSTRACEVCHSKTTYHRFDTTLQSNLGHNNKTDCIRCHEHKVGFRASCDSCHGTPPVSVGGLVTTDENGPRTTGSTTPGEHQKHAVDLGFDCNTCHSGWDGANQMPNSANLNILFKPSVNTRFAWAVNPIDSNNSYEGRPSAGAAYTTGAGTTVTQDTAAVDMSCALYCHGYGQPVWNPTSSVACGSCHGEVGSGPGYRAGAPTGIGASKDLSGSLTGFKVGKHSNHLDDSVARTGDPCSLCHNGYSYTDLTHVNGTVNISMHPSADLDTGGGVLATYTPGAPGECSNMNCHGTTPWDSAAVLTCTQSCHAYPPSSSGGGVGTYIAYPANGGVINFVDHDTPNGPQYLKDNHGQCKYCHGWNDDGDGALPIVGMTAAELTAMNGNPAEVANFINYRTSDGTGYHNESAFIGSGAIAKIAMNADADADSGNDSAYNPTNGGCDNAVCHDNDVDHRFNVGGGSGNIIQPADIGPGDCGACHTTGVGGATVVTPTSPHTKVLKTGSFTGCGSCHSGHYTKAGGVQIPNNLAVGINYTGTQHGGIKLGGPGTDSSISGKTTEAEICWGCHDLVANAVSEWGTNSKMAGSPVPTQYDNGTLDTSNWTTATWTSGKTDFAYKTGAIQSTHTANDAGHSNLTTAAGASNYSKVETVDDVANIRCSYCHDVHDTVGTNGKPYLRGTWWSNPYEEDGAPQAGQTYVNDTRFGAVPRGNGAKTRRLGGFWIDINNVQPGTASTTVNGTAYVNPTATGGSGTGGAWTFGDSAGLCILCHTNNVSTMDQTTGEGLWLGTANGHANAVIDGSGIGGTNIFNSRGGTTNSSNPLMHWFGTGRPEDRNSGYRNGNESQYNYTPSLNPSNTENNEDTTPGTNNWGSLTINNTTVNSKYHKFSCSKCHNPHASRLPKLMVTNCLDTKHNTWDDNKSLVAQAGINQNRSFSNWSSAQNCHRLGGIIPANRVIPGTGGTYVEPVDTGAVGAAHETGTSYGNRGWNVVTPW